MIPLIDSHCHLADEVFAADLPDVVSRCREAGVTRALCVLAAGDSAEAAQADRLEALWDGVRFSVGVHPHTAGAFEGRVDQVTELLEQATSMRKRVCAIGEIGLDYHYDYSPKAVQQELFAAQIRLAVSLNLPIIIHTREADDDTLSILDREGRGKVRGVLHCFTGSREFAREGLDRGLFVSFAGIVTFPKAADLRDVAAIVPSDRILVETDSPFLAPVPHRGKRNEPAWVGRTLAVLADVRNVTVETLAAETAANFSTLFEQRTLRAWRRGPRRIALRPRPKYDGRALSQAAEKTPSGVGITQIFEPIRDDLEQVEREFRRHVQSQVDLIPKIGDYIQKSGGKRIRPAVLLMASRLSGYQGDRAILYASVVEFIHTATLVHDDIIDDADLRRGRLAVHSRWGNDITVLLGDYLYIKSMALALTQDALEIIRLLCDVTLRMIEGELYQLTKNGEIGINEEEHFDIIRRKTAYLFGGCAQIGGLLGRVSPEQVRALQEYGFNLGIAFQLVDDLLDFTGDAGALGKPIGGDLREGKVTLPIIYLLQRSNGTSTRAEELVRDVIRDRAVTPERWGEITRLLAEHRATDYAYHRAVEYASAAKKHLFAFPPSPQRDALLALPDYLLSRDR